jgi:hypothetical protein
MAVIINELEVVLEPPPPKPQAAVQPSQEKPPLSPLDALTVREREVRNRLRLQAH